MTWTISSALGPGSGWTASAELPSLTDSVTRAGESLDLPVDGFVWVPAQLLMRVAQSGTKRREKERILPWFVEVSFKAQPT